MVDDGRPDWVPAEAEPVETSEGLVWVDNLMVYGPCSIITPHDEDGTLHELVGRDLPPNVVAFGSYCL